MTPSSARLRTVAVILAGGTGSRVGLDIPKQLLKIAGKTILEHTLDAFESHRDVDEILVMMASGHTEEAQRLVSQGGYRKVGRVLEGGAQRSDTTCTAIDVLSASQPGADCLVLFHDAVRPLIDPRIITDCVAALSSYAAVDVAIPSADTVITVDEAGLITTIPPRERLRRGQTPQGFRLSVIRRAYELAHRDPDFAARPATDDCGVVLRYLPDTPIYVVPGNEHNMKVTHPVDVHIADKLFQLASCEPPPAAPPDEQRCRLAGKTLVVFGGSYGIGGDVCTIARRFGAQVFAFSRSQTGTHVECADEVRAALRQAHDATGRIDFVVNTAGVLHTGKLADTDPGTIEETVRVNYLAPVTIAQAAIGYLAATRGHLLLYTSSSYTRGRAGYSLYSSSKAAVVNLTQALADEWSPMGVKVNCVNPERTQTPMRLRAFGAEPPGTLLSSMAVALTSIDVLVSDLTGHVIDVRRIDPLAGAGAYATEASDPTDPHRPPTRTQQPGLAGLPEPAMSALDAAQALAELSSAKNPAAFPCPDRHRGCGDGRPAGLLSAAVRHRRPAHRRRRPAALVLDVPGGGDRQLPGRGLGAAGHALPGGHAELAAGGHPAALGLPRGRAAHPAGPGPAAHARGVRRLHAGAGGPACRPGRPLGAGDLREPASAPAADHPQRGPGPAADPGPPAASARCRARQDDPVP
jgi:2-C-methyl-D-erythritol 4-phosphate cytidylyltransferase